MPSRIHERLKKVYGYTTVNASTVRRWIHHYIAITKLKGKHHWLMESGAAGRRLQWLHATFSESMRSFVMTAGWQQMNCAPLTPTVKAAWWQLFNNWSTQKFVHGGYWKLTGENRDKKNNSLRTITALHFGGEELSGGKYDWRQDLNSFLDMNQRDSQWNGLTQPRWGRKDSKLCDRQGKLRWQCFWSAEGVILVNSLEHGCTVNPV
jgi:hypothetical protein